MRFTTFFGRFKKSKPEDMDQGPTSDAVESIKNWYTDRYEGAVIQRNVMAALLFIALAVIAASLLTLRFVKNSKSLEPFVIEIDQKTGVPTVVDPVTIKAYSSDESIKRYFIYKYVKAREEYYANTYQYNYGTVVRVLSDDKVYYSDYRPKFGTGNPTSPANLYGTNLYRIVTLKSMIFQTDSSAQVRFTMQTPNSPSNSAPIDKIALIQFEFQNLKMNEDERLINPLGFRVTLYRLEDEKV